MRARRGNPILSLPDILRQAGRRGFLLFLLLLLPLSSHSAPLQPSISAAPQRKTLILLAPPGVTYDDLRPTSTVSEMRKKFAAEGSVALLNPAVAGEPTDEAAYLSLGAGERLSAQDHTSPRLEEAGVPRTVADMAQEAYTLKCNEGPAARAVYERRFGSPIPADAAVAHVGVPALRDHQTTAHRAAQIGALGDALKRAGRRVAVYGDWPAALVGMDSAGIVPGGSIYRAIGPKQITAALLHADVAIISAQDKYVLKLYTRAALPLGRRGQVDVLLVAPAPVRTPGETQWARLGWVIALGPDFPPGSVLTSPTTHTPGLVANVDIAPTILALQNAGTLPGTAGRPLYAIPARSNWGILSRLDAQATATAKSSAYLMVTYAAFAIGSGMLALIALRRRNATLRIVAQWGLLISAAVLLSLLPTGWLAPSEISRYIATVFGIAGLLALAAFYTGRWLRLPPVALLFAAVTLTVMVDACFGSPLVQRAINNFLPGIRFYGIGNEYLGIVLGASLTCVGLFALPRRLHPFVWALWAALTVLISLPQCGAKAGGALSATFTFVLAALSQRGKKLGAGPIAIAFSAGLAALAAQAALDAMLPHTSRTHIGEAVASAQNSGMASLVEIAGRKLAMNLALAFHPFTLGALAGLVPLWWMLTRGEAGKQARTALAHRPEFAQLLPAVFGGAAVVLLFNDSGIVGALLLLACPTNALIFAMLEDAASGADQSNGSSGGGSA